MSQTEKRDFSKPVKLIHNLLPKEQQKLMEFPLDSMIGYVEETGDTEGKGAEANFRTFMLLYRHWLISEKKYQRIFLAIVLFKRPQMNYGMRLSEYTRS